MKLLLLVLLYLPFCVFAKEQTDHWYHEVSLYGLVDQTEKITNGSDSLLLDYSSFAYSLETGLNINLEDESVVRLGFYYYDLIGQSRYSKNIHNPKLFEVFADRVFTYKGFYGTIGAGIKIYEDKTFDNPKGQDIKTISNPFLEKFSARFAIGKKIGYNISLELNHHSNWFIGKPLNDYWEYHQTSVCIAYEF